MLLGGGLVVVEESDMCEGEVSVVGECCGGVAVVLKRGQGNKWTYEISDKSQKRGKTN